MTEVSFFNKLSPGTDTSGGKKKKDKSEKKKRVKYGSIKCHTKERKLYLEKAFSI